MQARSWVMINHIINCLAIFIKEIQILASFTHPHVQSYLTFFLMQNTQKKISKNVGNQIFSMTICFVVWTIDISQNYLLLCLTEESHNVLE